MKSKDILTLIAKITFLALTVFAVMGAYRAEATTTPGGMLIYGDGTAGALKHQINWATSTWEGEVSTSVGAASALRWPVLKNLTATNAKIAAMLKADGSMDVLLYNATSTNAWTLQFTVSGVGVTSAPFTKAVDIFVEPVSGDAVVVYGKTGTNGSFFYRVWDGDTWTGESSQSLTDMAGPAHWISATSRYSTSTPSNDGAISVIDDTNDDIFAIRWNGSSWVNGVMLTNASPSTMTGRASVAFEGQSGKLVAVYTNQTSNVANPWKYNRLDPGTGLWSATSSLPNAGASSVGRWVSLAQGPDDLIAFTAQSSDATTLTTAPTFDPYIWSGTASSSVWFKGNGDTSAGTMNQRGGDVGWESFSLSSNTTPEALFVSTQSTTALVKEYVTFTYKGSFSTVTNVNGSNSDDIQYIEVESNGTDYMTTHSNDIDADLFTHWWNGSTGFSGSPTLRENATPDGSPNTRTTWQAFDFEYEGYIPWMRNWQWLDDSEASVASQNATSSLADGTTYRLRINLQETGSTTQFAASKKLQYTDSTTPDASGTTWTDVGPQGSASIWRYANGSDTELGTIGSNLLSSTTVSGVYLESGYASTTHATTTVTEYDYAITPNGVTPGTNYSFRLFDNEFGKPVSRKQNSSVGAKCGTDALATCWYPAARVTAQIEQVHYRWRNDDGNEAAASFMKADDTAISQSDDVNIGTRKRLRFLVKNTGTVSATSYQFKLEHASSSCSSWYEVGTDSTGKGFVMDLSSNVADLASTTDSSVSNPSGTFDAGYVMTSSNKTNAMTVASAHFTELEYSIKPASGAEVGLLYCFRLTNNGDGEGFTWTQQPQITLSSFVRSGGGSVIEMSGTGPIINGGTPAGGTGTDGSGSGGQQQGGGQGGGGGDVGYLFIPKNLAMGDLLWV